MSPEILKVIGDDKNVDIQLNGNTNTDPDDDEDATTTTSMVFLTLGDGDFSWSLDLARFLASTHSVDTHCQQKLIATGIDEFKDLSKKYRNSNYILRELKRTAARNAQLSIEVRHGVNAIVDCHKDKLSNQGSLPKAHIVIFNHPHLGTEDAVMHSRFLCHLFHSIDKVWLTPSTRAIFYLTLAKGQYERWHCEKAAISNGFHLYQRLLFQPTPLDNASYEHRRHQTGKSFASRTVGSETFAFIRKNISANSFVSMLCLPWFQTPDVMDTSKKGRNCTTENKEFTCPLCQKIFAEERSVKKHIVAKHDSEYHPEDATTAKRLRDESHDRSELLGREQRFPCSCCPNTRDFASSNALKDHMLAKHLSIHKAISAERGFMSKGIIQSVQSETRTNCNICNIWFTDSQQKAEHMKSFVPVPEQEEEHHRCQFCLKVFREKRSRLQHENFCAIGRETNLLKLPYEHEN
jgi:uncharacterized C2H2 Zn-finger protein